MVLESQRRLDAAIVAVDIGKRLHVDDDEGHDDGGVGQDDVRFELEGRAAREGRREVFQDVPHGAESDDAGVVDEADALGDRVGGEPAVEIGSERREQGREVIRVRDLLDAPEVDPQAGDDGAHVLQLRGVVRWAVIGITKPFDIPGGHVERARGADDGEALGAGECCRREEDTEDEPRGEKAGEPGTRHSKSVLSLNRDMRLLPVSAT